MPPKVDARGIGMSCPVRESGTLEVLEPYTELVELHLSLDCKADGADYPADFLAPVAKLPALEVLHLVVPPELGPEVLRPLRAAPKLRFLQLSVMRALTIADVTALQELPHLVGLSITGSVLGEGGRVDRAAIRALGLLPSLRWLTLGNLGGCSEEVLGELRNLRSLRRLQLERLGAQPVAVRLGRMPEVVGVPKAAIGVDAVGAVFQAGEPPADWELVRNERRRRIQNSPGLSPAVAAALADLPKLCELRLETCAVSAAAIAALPATLTGISILACPDADATVYEALGRFEDLRHLQLGRTSSTTAAGPFVGVVTGANADEPGLELPDQQAVDRAQAKLLRALPIASFAHHWPMLPELAAALAEASMLRMVELENAERGDLEAVARAPALRELSVGASVLAPADFEPLRAAKRLAVLRMTVARLAPARIEALLPGVEIEVEFR